MLEHKPNLKGLSFDPAQILRVGPRTTNLQPKFHQIIPAFNVMDIHNHGSSIPDIWGKANGDLINQPSQMVGIIPREEHVGTEMIDVCK